MHVTYVDMYIFSSSNLKPIIVRAYERSTHRGIVSLPNDLADSFVTRWALVSGVEGKTSLFFQVHYVSDHWEAFKMAQGDTLDPSMLLRLQVEYDNFFLRAAR